MAKRRTRARATKKRSVRRGSVAIDTVPLPEKVFRMKFARGRVSRVRSKYILTVGRKRIQIPIGTLLHASDVRQLVGKDVHVALSNKKRTEIVAIGTWPTPERPRIRPRWIACYIPAPDMMRRIDLGIRRSLVRKMTSEKIITSRMAREVIRGIER